MDLRYVSDGLHLDRKDLFGRDAPVPWWPSTDSGPLFLVHTGDNSAGNGGDGYFAGSLVDKSYAAFGPLNMAQAGTHATADAHQSNTVQFLQGASQAAGGGGHGGNDNAASGGGVSVFAAGASDHNWINSDLIASGGNHAGDGGDGYFYGSIVHASFILYNPINIAVAGYNSNAHADQTNNVIFDQSAFQMAGIGGNGGSGNTATGGGVSVSGSQHGTGHNWINSDMIASGGHHAGSGGDGHFAGSLIDLNIAIYAPINIAVAGPNSTADAHQTNNVLFDQSAVQIAGVGGDGGHGNTAFGGDFAMHVLADDHLLGHA